MSFQKQVKVASYISQEEMAEFDNKVQELYIYYINILTELLNVYHGVNCSDRYWKIVVGKWLQYFLAVLYKNYQVENSVVPEEEYFTSNNFSHGDDFRYIVDNGEAYALISKYISYYMEKYRVNKKLCNYRATPKLFPAKKIDNLETLYQSIHDTNAITSDFKNLVDNENWYILNHLLSKNHVEILQMYNNKELLPYYNFDLEKRKQLFLRNSLDEFDFIFRNFLVWNFPFFYLESFEIANYLSATKYPKKHFQTIFVCDFVDYSSFLLDIFIAKQVEIFHAKLISVQHGGGYGMWPGLEAYEKDVSDRFVSFGWGNKNFIKMPNLLLLRGQSISNNVNTRKLLLISTWERGHRSLNDKGVVSDIGYRDDIVDFLRIILKKGIAQTEWRTYRARYHHGEGDFEEYIIDKLGDLANLLSIDAEGTAMQRIQQARVLVLDHLATTPLESIGRGIPTVMFWNPGHLLLTDEAKQICKTLEKARILHYSPRKAAFFVLSIFDSVNQWWNSPEVLEAREEFNLHFSRNSDSVLADYASLFINGTPRRNAQNMLTDLDRNYIKEWERKFYPNSDIRSAESLNEYRVYLFGAGKYGRKMAHLLKETGVFCVGFIDNAPKLQGTIINGMVVYSLVNYKTVKQPNDIIIICLINEEFSVKMQLLEEGISCFMSMWQLGLL